VCAWEEVDGVYPSVPMVPSLCGARGEVLGDQGVRGVTGPESSDEEPRGSSGRSAVPRRVPECGLGVDGGVWGERDSCKPALMLMVVASAGGECVATSAGR
jgi:hypothetical protein